MPSPVFYSASPFGTGTIETGAGNITIANGVATLTVEQTGNIGAGVCIEYNSIECWIAPNRIGFDSGGTTELLPDTKIEDATSGATGIVRYVELLSGSWAGGDAAGWIYFESTTGTFGDDNIINRTKPTASANIATVDGTIEGNIGNGNTEFVVKSATGSDAANQTETAVTSIHHEYASLSAFEAGFIDANHINNTNLTNADVVAFACCYYDHDDSTADTTGVTINFGTTGASNYLQVYAPVGHAESINSQRHAGVYDNDKCRLEVANATVLRIEEDYCIVEGLQIKLTDATAARVLLSFYDQTSGANLIIIDSCILTCDAGSKQYARVYSGETDLIITLVNSLFYSMSNEYFGNIRFAANTVNVLYCTVSDGYYGLRDSGGTWTVSNCAVFNNTADFYGSPDSITYCASDDGDCDDATCVNISPGGTETDDWADAFEGYSNSPPDFRPKTGSCLIEAGTPLHATNGIWRDIAGNERDASTPDIGAFEYVAGGINIPLDKLVFVSSPKDLTVSPSGEVGISLDKLTANGTPKDLTVSPGTTTVSLDKLLAEAIPKDLTLSFGTATISLDKLTATTAAKDLDVSLGGLFVPIDKLSIASSPKDLTVTPSETIILPDKLTVTSSPKDLTLSFGTATISLDKLTIATAAKDLTVSPSDTATVSIDKLTASFSPKDLNVSAAGLVLGTNCGFITESPSGDPDNLQVYLGGGTAMAFMHTSPAGTNVVTEIGWWQGQSNNAAAAYNVGIYADDEGSPGDLIATQLTGQSTTVNTAGWYKYTGLSISISGSTDYWIAVGIEPHDPHNAADYLSSPGSGVAFKFDSLSDETLLDPFEVEGGNANILYSIYAKYEAGNVNIELDKLVVASSPKDLAVTPSETTVIIDKLVVSSSPKDLTLSFGTATVSIDKLSVASSPKDLIVSVPGTDISIDRLTATVAAKDLTVSISGEVGISVDRLSIVSDPKDLSVTPSGEVGILIDRLVVASSPKDLNVSPSETIVTIDRLVVAGAAQDLSVYTAILTISMDALAVSGAALDLSVLTIMAYQGLQPIFHSGLKTPRFHSGLKTPRFHSGLK